MTRVSRHVGLQRFAVAASDETAARWRALLEAAGIEAAGIEAAGIEAAVELEDARAFGFGSRAYPGLQAEPLCALIDGGWDGRRVDGRTVEAPLRARLVMAGALGTLAVTAALVLALLWRGW